MSRVATSIPHVNEGFVEHFLTTLNKARAEMIGPAPATPSLAPVIDSPLYRDQRQEMELVTVAVANTLREQL